MRRLSSLFFLIISILSAPQIAKACACGCGVFDVGTSSILPTDSGFMGSFQYYFINQNKNWSGLKSSPSANNDMLQIRTNFLTIMGRYMLDRSWGAEMSIPFAQRHVEMLDSMGSLMTHDHFSLGDMRVKGIYSGFSPDMSTGLTFGFRFPTGDYKYANFDRDTQIGTGTTDLLVGAYHMGSITNTWNWFTNGEVDQPFVSQGGYRQGTEVNGVLGLYYQGWMVGDVKIAPIFQMLGSLRLHDEGSAADADNTGYGRVLAAGGFELDTTRMKIYADASVPVLQHVRGNQLTSFELFKLSVSYNF